MIEIKTKQFFYKFYKLKIQWIQKYKTQTLNFKHMEQKIIRRGKMYPQKERGMQRTRRPSIQSNNGLEKRD